MNNINKMMMIIIIISFMQGMYTYIPETNYYYYYMTIMQFT